MDILPSDLSTYGGAAKDLLTDLQSRNERMFNMTFLVLHTAETRQKLEIAVSQAASVAQTYNCLLTRLDFQQEDGLMSSLPLGLNRIKIERSLTTSALAVFVPFVTQEVFMGGDAMYYGLNALSNNMILLDRKQSRCPNGLVFGTPGSGKSMSCKREITFILKEMGISFPGASGIWWGWRTRPPTTTAIRSGGMRTFPSCPPPSAMWCPRKRPPSSTFSVP